MKPLLLSLTTLCLLPLLAAYHREEAPQAAETARIRVLCLPAQPLALVVAREHGLFTKYGVGVQAEVAANSEALRSGLTEGKYELAHAAVDNAVALVEKSKTDVVVVMGGEGSTNELIVQPEIHAVDDLRGRTVIVDAPTTAYALQLKKMLLLSNLEAGRDYEIKVVGGTPLRLAAMREHKEFAASILGPPASLIAKEQGLVSLGTTRKLLGPYQGIGAFVQRSWAAKNREVLTGYLAAFVEAQNWILDPKNKGEVVALLEREAKLTPALATATYDAWIVAPDGLQPDARVDVIGFENVLKLRADVENTWNGKPPAVEKYYDRAFYDAALAKVSRVK